MRSMTRLLALTGALLLLPVAAAGQQDPLLPPEGRALRVFLDCQNVWCDFDHLRREIGWVDWVRDRQVAQVHVLGTQRGTGAGGQEVTLSFIGLRRFADDADTLTFRTGVTDTDAERREALTRTLALGLARFAAATPLAERLRILYDVPDDLEVAEPQDDPWNFWVFTLRAGGGLDGEDLQREVEVGGGVTATRVTDAWKLFLDFDADYSLEEFDVEEGDTVRTIEDEQTEFGFFALSAWSVGPHWSVGMLLDFERSTFDNLDFALEGGPAVEFSVFPYAESTRRAITLRYAVGAGTFNYREETVFTRLAETRPLHQVDVGVRVQQPWGAIHGGVNARQFLHDPALHRIDLNGGLSLRIFRGLRFNLFGNVARVKDQLNLPAGELTPEEILLQQRLLGTAFEYRTDISFSYTFGSIFNNVVNPRF